MRCANTRAKRHSKTVEELRKEENKERYLWLLTDEEATTIWQGNPRQIRLEDFIGYDPPTEFDFGLGGFAYEHCTPLTEVLSALQEGEDVVWAWDNEGQYCLEWRDFASLDWERE